MLIKLKCIKDCNFQDFTAKRGQSVRAVIWDGDKGIRFDCGAIWSYPYLISVVEKYFITDFDDEEWERRKVMRGG